MSVEPTCAAMAARQNVRAPAVATSSTAVGMSTASCGHASPSTTRPLRGSSQSLPETRSEGLKASSATRSPCVIAVRLGRRATAAAMAK